jgi:hypothetical protein
MNAVKLHGRPHTHPDDNAALCAHLHPNADLTCAACDIVLP